MPKNDDTQDPTAEIEEMEQQQRRMQPTPSLNGTQIAFLAIYTGLSGVAGVAASTLFDSLLRQLAAGLSAAVLTFGIAGLVGLYVFGSSDGK